jgi:hypothetical protein
MERMRSSICCSAAPARFSRSTSDWNGHSPSSSSCQGSRGHSTETAERMGEIEGSISTRASGGACRSAVWAWKQQERRQLDACRRHLPAEGRSSLLALTEWRFARSNGVSLSRDNKFEYLHTGFKKSVEKIEPVFTERKSISLPLHLKTCRAAFSSRSALYIFKTAR